MPTKKERLDALEADLRTYEGWLSDLRSLVDSEKRGTAASFGDLYSRSGQRVTETEFKQAMSTLKADVDARIGYHDLRYDERLEDMEKAIDYLNKRLSGSLSLLDLEGKLNEMTARHDRLSEDLDAVSDRLTLLDNRHTARHDQAMEIVGTRIGELVDRLDVLNNDSIKLRAKADVTTDFLGHLSNRLDKIEQTLSAPFFQTKEQPLYSQAAETWRQVNEPVHGDPVPFPTGAATTVDDALAAVPPVDDSPPLRGDRVRLEGARDHMGRRITDGWYEVVGHDDIPSFQITTRESTSRDELGAWMPWLRPSDSLKEIRRAPTPRSPIEPEDGLDV